MPATSVSGARTPQRAFPAANTDVVANHICGGHSTGSGNVALGVLATNGSIGYADVATAPGTRSCRTGSPAPQQDFQDYRTTSGTRDDTFWIPLQNNPDQTSGNTYVEPTKDVTNHQATGSGEVGTPGANCTNLPNLQGVPTAASSPNGDATLGDWSHAVAAGGSGYPVCVLTYGLIWDDNSRVYGNTPSEEAQARTVLDYVNYIASSFGQSFNQTDFSAQGAWIREDHEDRYARWSSEAVVSPRSAGTSRRAHPTARPAAPRRSRRPTRPRPRRPRLMCRRISSRSRA